MLFCVVTRGVERMRPLPDVSSADSATSRLNEPLTDPSARPTALVAPETGRFTTPGAAVVPAPTVVPTAPPIEPAFGNASGVVLPSVGLTWPLKPHCTPSARA